MTTASYMRDYRAMKLTHLYPAAPLVWWAKNHWEMLDEADRLYIWKLQQHPDRQVTWWRADELAVTMGMHPSGIYGLDWFA